MLSGRPGSRSTEINSQPSLASISITLSRSTRRSSFVNLCCIVLILRSFDPPEWRWSCNWSRLSSDDGLRPHVDEDAGRGSLVVRFPRPDRERWRERLVFLETSGEAVGNCRYRRMPDLVFGARLDDIGRVRLVVVLELGAGLQIGRAHA